jgi:ABC-type sugar transport system ATPase subunit
MAEAAPARAGSEHTEAAPAVASHGLVKQFGGTRALDGVDVTVGANEIHALIGENGAGKSTFLGIVAARIAPTSGSVAVFGEPHDHRHPRQARQAGIIAIYQELTIVPARSALHNVFLATPRRRGGAFMHDAAMRRRYHELSERLGVSIPPDTPARNLSVADQQSLEIMRALDTDARLMLLDEPTASLAPPEREALFRTMRELKRQGVTMVFVSHNLDEVLSVADAVTVFRNGSAVASGPVAAWTKERMVRQMLGHAEPVWSGAPATVRQTSGDEVLRAEGITVPKAVEGIDVRVSRGEVVGLGGLVGSGRTTVLRALAGLEPSSTGRIWIDGEERRWPRSPREALGYGIALVPEDRKDQGLVQGLSAMRNITLSDLRSVSRHGFVSRRLMRERARELAGAYGFDAARVEETTRNLSGGNQQKLLLARWAHRPPRVLLCDEPTRGIDVGAKEEILATLQRLAAGGLAVVVVSSELEEVVAISDRVTVLSEGRAVAELGAEQGGITVERILGAAFGLEEAA